MAKTTDSARIATALTALRGVIIVVAGIFTLIYPTEAVRFLVFIGGGILLVDGVLSFAAIDFEGQRDTRFWVVATRSAFAILAGLAVLLSPWLIPIVGLLFLIYFVGLQAIGVGIIEIIQLFVPVRKPASMIWPSVITGGSYALFGLVLIVMPLSSAAFLAQIVGILMIVFAGSLFIRVWQQRVRTDLVA